MKHKTRICTEALIENMCEADASHKQRVSDLKIHAEISAQRVPIFQQLTSEAQFYSSGTHSCLH